MVRLGIRPKIHAQPSLWRTADREKARLHLGYVGRRLADRTGRLVPPAPEVSERRRRYAGPRRQDSRRRFQGPVMVGAVGRGSGFGIGQESSGMAAAECGRQQAEDLLLELVVSV